MRFPGYRWRRGRYCDSGRGENWGQNRNHDGHITTGVSARFVGTGVVPMGGSAYWSKLTANPEALQRV